MDRIETILDELYGALLLADERLEDVADSYPNGGGESAMADTLRAVIAGLKITLNGPQILDTLAKHREN